MYPTQHEIVNAFSGIIIDLSPEPICRIANRGYRNICGHATFSDVTLLFQIKNVWKNAVEYQIQRTVAECNQCRAAAKR